MSSASVLNVSHNYFVQGGSDQYFLTLEKLLTEHGHKVVPFCARDERNRPTPYSRYFPQSPDFSAASVGDTMRFFYSLSARQAMSEIIRQERPDLAHLHIYYGKLTPSILAPLKEAGLPIVQTVHEYKLICPVYTLVSNGVLCEECKPRQFRAALRRKCNRNSFPRTLVSVSESYLSAWLGDVSHVDKFIAVSGFVRQKLIEHGIPAEKIAVIHNFVTDATQDEDVEPDDYFLFSGRVEGIKGIFTLLSALERLPHVRCLVAGQGTDYGYLQEEIRRRRIENVELLGFVPPQQLRKLMRAALCNVVPSEWYEPFGLVAIESMACARPVIASRIGGLQEIVADGRDGLLFEPGNVDELVQAIDYLYRNRDRAEEMGRAAGVKARDKFGAQHHYEQLAEVYESVLPRTVRLRIARPEPASSTVLNVSHNYHVQGGSDRYFLELEKLLKNRGHHVIPYCARDAMNQPSDYSEYFPAAPDVANPSVVDAARFIYSREARKRLQVLLNREQVEIAHLHIYYGKLTTSILDPLRDRNIPIVQTLHEYKLLCPVYTCVSNGEICEACHGKDFWKVVARRCHKDSVVRSFASAVESYASKMLGAVDGIDHFIGASHFMTRKMREIGIPEEKLSTIHNFVDYEQYAADNSGGDYLLYFGRIEKNKGIFTLLDAMQKLPDVQCIIVGEGPERLSVARTIAQYDIDNVRLLPATDGTELHDLVRNSFCTVLPSQWYENCPMSVLESMALGKAVIGSDIGGIPEVVSDGETGVLVPPGAVDALADAIAQLAGNPSRSIDLGRAGRLRAEQEFSPRLHYERLQAVYAGLAH